MHENQEQQPCPACKTQEECERAAKRVPVIGVARPVQGFKRPVLAIDCPFCGNEHLVARHIGGDAQQAEVAAWIPIRITEIMEGFS